VRSLYGRIVFIAVLTCLAIGCTAKEKPPLILGTPVGKQPYQSFGAQQLSIEFDQNLDKPVRVHGEFGQIDKHSPDPDFILVEFYSEFKKLFIYCHKKVPGAELLAELKKGDPIQIYGVAMVLKTQGYVEPIHVIKVVNE
jgi:hypothetical protein